jgi:tetratricopeptide (TPR) repeat protein
MTRGYLLRAVKGRTFAIGVAFGLLAWIGAPSSARAQPAPVDAAAEAETRAKAHYRAGLAAYEEGRFLQAIAAFSAADQAAPRAALAFNIARAYDRLDDAALALRFYREYLRRELSPVNAEGVRARIAELESALSARGLQQVTILSEPAGAFVSIDGQPRGPTPWTGELPPGRHDVSLLKEGYAVVKRELVLDPAHATDLRVELGAPTVPAARPAVAPAAPKASRTPRASSRRPAFGPWPWVTLGAGGATLVAAAGFELSRAAAERDARAATPQIEYVDRYQAMRSRQTAARVLVGVGGALVVAGGVLVVLDLANREGAPAAAMAGCSGEGCSAYFRGVW